MHIISSQFLKELKKNPQRIIQLVEFYYWIAPSFLSNYIYNIFYQRSIWNRQMNFHNGLLGIDSKD